MKNIVSLCLLGCLSMAMPAAAQQNKEINKDRLLKLRNEFRQHPPKALLVQIFTHPRLKEYYTNSQQTKRLKTFAEDIEGYKTAMVADFNDNFHYCPVYYFYDTTAEKVKQGQFEGVLLDSNLNPVKNMVISAKDTNFFVTYFGNSVPENVTTSYGWNGTVNKDDELNYSHASSLRQAFKLVVMDHNFVQLPSYTELWSAVAIGRKWRNLPKYTYNSAHLSIYYWAFAGILSRNLTEFYTIRD